MAQRHPMLPNSRSAFLKTSGSLFCLLNLVPGPLIGKLLNLEVVLHVPDHVGHRIGHRLGDGFLQAFQPHLHTVLDMDLSRHGRFMNASRDKCDTD